MMHKRIQPLKITAAMKNFFQKLNSNWEYIKNKKKEILRLKKQCKTASENQSALWNGGSIHTTN